MVQKTVLKVDISCEKCKKKILKAVSGLKGVDKIEIDGAKGTLMVMGEADPYEIIVRAKKSGKFIEVVSIGPPPAPPKQDGPKKADDKKPDEKKPEEKKGDQKAQAQIQTQTQSHIHMPYMGHSCPVCERMAVIHTARWEEPNPSCSIL